MSTRFTTTIRLSAAALIAAGALGLAACGSDDSSDTATASSSDDTVSVQSIGDSGDVLVDSDGAALYSPDEEANGKILCTGKCESIWMPLVAANPTAGSDVGGDVATVKRPDGSEQVTFDGKPLYTFTQEGAGEVTGDGLADAFGGRYFTWHVMTPSGAASGGSSSSADQSGGGYSY